MFSQDNYLRALNFAAKAHGAQKTPIGLPYVVHITSVTMELIAALRVEPGNNEDLAVFCALLHDVLEDTPISAEELEREFGRDVLSGVQALTKDATIEKAGAMEDSLARILRQPKEIAMVKLADRITNLAPPPPHWTPDKVQRYRVEAEVILSKLGFASAALSSRFNERLAAYPRV